MATHFSRTVLLLTRPRHAQDWLEQDKPDFIRKDEWPPNSLDLNPLDFHVWEAMLHRYQQCICAEASKCRGTARNAEDDLERLATRFYPGNHLGLPRKIEGMHRSGRWTL